MQITGAAHNSHLTSPSCGQIQLLNSIRKHAAADYRSNETTAASSSHGIKRSPLDNDDEESQAMLAQRSAKRRMNSDYEHYSSVPNDPTIKLALGWWRANHALFPDLAKMARDTLAVPVSGCSVEWMFSISGCIATWQRSRLRDSTISDLMMYKAALNLREFVLPELEEEEDYPVNEVVGNIPAELEQDWWKKKLHREVHAEIMDRFIEDDE